MKTRAAFLILSAAMSASLMAADFPLKFKVLSAQEMVNLPGASGTYGSLQARKPDGSIKEPKAVSKTPLYGQLGDSKGATYRYRLDESKGTGKGYDVLVIDLNGNQDLTDDPVLRGKPVPGLKTTAVNSAQQLIFGPITTPPARHVGAMKPVYYAQSYVVNQRSITGSMSSTVAQYLGNLRLRAAWCLETTVDLGGVKQKCALYDNDASMSLGGAPKAMSYQSGTERVWVFSGGDSVLQDVDGSGSFDILAAKGEARPFGEIIYVGGKPLRASLAPDWKSLRLEALPEPPGTLVIQPAGTQVDAVSLAMQTGTEEWRLLRAEVVNGRATVPAGTYRLYSTTLAANTGSRESMVVSGYERAMKSTVQVVSGGTANLTCGGPLDLQLSAAPVRLASATPGSGEFTLRISAKVMGKAGELCSSFSKIKGTIGETPTPPQFQVKNLAGKVVASGKMEFG